MTVYIITVGYEDDIVEIFLRKKKAKAYLKKIKGTLPKPNLTPYKVKI